MYLSAQSLALCSVLHSWHNKKNRTSLHFSITHRSVLQFGTKMETNKQTTPKKPQLQMGNSFETTWNLELSCCGHMNHLQNCQKSEFESFEII